MENDAQDLMLSGIKHYQFCRRRWALVHVEQQWQENALTVDGHHLHERVHDKEFTEMRGSVLLSRAMPVRSATMGITGECDLVELYRDPYGVPIHGREGTWRLYPVEYKRGKPDSRGADEMQLCAQAMCLEEMFVTEIPEGALYYAALHQRRTVAFSAELRQKVRAAVSDMHRLMERGYTPRAKWTKACKSCSLVEVCQPEVSKGLSASEYVRRALEVDE